MRTSRSRTPAAVRSPCSQQRRGNFTRSELTAPSGMGGTHLSVLAAADFDKDGRTDLAGRVHGRQRSRAVHELLERAAVDDEVQGQPGVVAARYRSLSISMPTAGPELIVANRATEQRHNLHRRTLSVSSRPIRSWRRDRAAARLPPRISTATAASISRPATNTPAPPPCCGIAPPQAAEPARPHSGCRRCPMSRRTRGRWADRTPSPTSIATARPTSSSATAWSSTQTRR